MIDRRQPLVARSCSHTRWIGLGQWRNFGDRRALHRRAAGSVLGGGFPRARGGGFGLISVGEGPDPQAESTCKVAAPEVARHRSRWGRACVGEWTVRIYRESELVRGAKRFGSRDR